MRDRRNALLGRTTRALTSSAVLLMSTYTFAQAGTSSRLQLKATSTSKISFEGNSTLHKFGAIASTYYLKASVPMAGGLTPNAALERAFQATPELEVKVPVTALKSGNRDLDRNMYRLLKAEQHPNILFRLRNQTSVQDASTGTYKVHATGDLTVAGHERTVQLELTGTLTSGAVKLTAGTALLMSDFGIEPPVMFLGTLRTDDKVLIKLDLTLEPSTSANNAAQ